jgi:hypothetical protein
MPKPVAKPERVGAIYRAKGSSQLIVSDIVLGSNL